MTRPTPVTRDPAEAAACLLSGGTVAIPTETVYGLAAVATDEDAVRRVFLAKGRPSDHPLIVHVDGPAMAARYGDIAGPAAVLAEHFWPGPLTLVVERTPLVGDYVTGGRDTVALRVPDHPLALDVIRRCGQGLVAPSANLFGHVSPTEPSHVLADLDGRIDMVLDGGRCRVGVESTIVDCSGGIQILRPGLVSVEDVEACTGQSVLPTSGPSRAPGMMASHYAPHARVLLANDPAEVESLLNGSRTTPGDIAVIGVGLSPDEYAADLYRLLRTADADGISRIVAILPPGPGLATAVRDRLIKAAADTSGRS